jgi:chromosome transmission fidelity protein 1
MRVILAPQAVFREPRTASAVEALLTRYGAAALAPRDAQHPGGALLLCVVGGKLSEGINFSDGLGRCVFCAKLGLSCVAECFPFIRGVVMVGLPYAPPSDTELSERMKWLDAAGPEQGGGVGAGRAHYEALCMRAVNQSIGRAIRHSRDYAAIVLADARWTKPGATAVCGLCYVVPLCLLVLAARSQAAW